ncbi:putative spermidine/putrescine transport system ATP-binding protein [Micromonospora viridifaciens]|uniref:ABC-type quaternary amine transporter n=1 Tax=Micromonospora viridifaciens TaxID=1881 RepID=A0A1C4ZMZ1_MICVI|nr:putative spermidine/putrescine transport system ATP-binding protein [Micromonospora viridifaciens]
MRVEGLSKYYGDVHAVDNVTLTVEPGEFVSLLGPSGSGKTTLLMAIAGFEKPDSGEVYVGDRRITGLPTHKRNLGVVFQRYALFPNMTVADNIGYALKVRGVSRSERAKAVAEAMDLVDLTGLAHRRPAALSGGQQQRVALARALVYRPPIVLFDEPLGALDRKLREQVQLEIRRLHQELGLTMIFVTHDQEEALVMSDRVALLRDGRIEQFGPGHELYDAPATEFVAGFLGRTNILDSTVTTVAGGQTQVALGDRRFPALFPADVRPETGQKCRVALRPEAIRLSRNDRPASLSGQVGEVVFSGPTTTVRVRVGDQELMVQGLSSDPAMRVREGATVHLEWDPAALRAFTSPGVPGARTAATANNSQSVMEGIHS